MGQALLEGHAMHAPNPHLIHPSAFHHTTLDSSEPATMKLLTLAALAGTASAFLAPAPLARSSSAIRMALGKWAWRALLID